MVETITPVVHGRRSVFVLSIVLHAIAATVTAAATGSFLGMVGMVAGAPWSPVGALIVGSVAFVYLLRETFRVPIPLPNARRQVPEWWRTYFSPPVAATLYGAGLGVAFITFLSYGTFVAVAAGALVSGDPLLGALLCAPFGLSRAVTVAAVGWRSTDTGAAVSSVASFGATAAPRAANAAVLALVVMAATAQLV